MTEPVPTDENLKKVRERVMQLAREIEQMSGQELPPPVYFQEFLTRVVTAVGARAGVVWLVEDTGRLNLVAQLNLEHTGLRETPGALGLNEKLLIDVMQTGEARTLTHGGEAKLPTEHVLVLSALHKEKKCVGVVELFQRPDVPVKAQSGYMQFLEQMCGYASRFLEGRRRNPEASADLKNQFWTDFEQFSLRLQRSLQEQEVADAAASDSRALLGCDRVSVAIRKGRSFQIRAVSGQSSVNARANLIVAMRKLSRRVIEMGETLVYTGRVEGLAPQVEEPLAAFVQESGSRMVMLVPMFENEAMVRKQGEEEDRERRKKRPKATGCLVIEQIAESEPLPQLEQRAELVADHVGAALWNSRQHGRIFGLSLWKLMGKTMEWFRGRKLAITTAVLLGIAGLVAFMWLFKLEYPVKAEGKWMPVEQHAVFAPHDGLITRNGIRIPKGQLVKKGDILIVLQNDELDGQIEEAKATIEKWKATLSSKQSEIIHARLQQRTEEGEQQGSAAATVKRLEVEEQRIQGDQKVAMQQLTQLQKRKDEKLTITAQADGRIPDFQLRQLLEDRPVRAGDHLFDIMNDGEGSKWQMELLVEEKRMGHLLSAQREQVAEGKSAELEGEFKLASQPEKEFTCHLTKVATRSTTDTELGTVFELTAIADDGQDLPPQRIGVEVTVHLYCGKTSLAYWCFGDVVEFVQKYIWL
ncbi:MAG: biotin/lipoyl-binding protein [Fuerstia sp.]|nr:biotin/lipoyl-binding protein [Fuerstiella sp.]